MRGPTRPWFLFLSCLHGSERCEGNNYNPDTFLSCLHGSERGFKVVIRLGRFLSCLHGSERVALFGRVFYAFLSCLHGSEPRKALELQARPFLSCLHGSELEPNNPNGLIVKEPARFFRCYPFFRSRLQVLDFARAPFWAGKKGQNQGTLAWALRP